MAETKSPDEPQMPAKRKTDLTANDQETLTLKSPKLQTTDETIQPKQDNHTLEPSGNNDSSLHEKEEPGIDAEEEDDDDDYEDEEEEENGYATVDRKGKGILIEEEQGSDNEDDDDDSSGGGDETEGESDLSDDPLAEVDLDNILPSRTRRRVVHPGVYIAQNVGNNGDGDDSDDSEA